MRPASTVVSTRLLRVKRHHASSSGPMPGSPLITATRSPGRLRRSAAINSGRRPEAKVFAPVSSSIVACIAIASSYNARRSVQFRSSVRELRRLPRHQNLRRLSAALRLAFGRMLVRGTGAGFSSTALLNPGRCGTLRKPSVGRQLPPKVSPRFASRSFRAQGYFS